MIPNFLSFRTGSGGGTGQNVSVICSLVVCPVREEENKSHRLEEVAEEMVRPQFSLFPNSLPL